MFRARWTTLGEKSASAPRLRLDEGAVLGFRRALTEEEARDRASRVLAARSTWTHDFDGEQFCLGRAFYTHLETGRSREYFQNAARADAAVEAALPGFQAMMLGLLARVIGAELRRRPGFCGPGIHIFPAGGKVASAGGVVHFDLEGLTQHQLTHRVPAVTLVLTLCPGERGGGLRVWDSLFEGQPDSEIETADHRSITVRARSGEALLIDSRRLHQIRPFSGDQDRITGTVHAAQIDRNVWETWF